MALRVLSGILFPDSSFKRKGSATIAFANNTVTGSAQGKAPKEVGPTGRFKSKPTRIVALQRFRFDDSSSSSAAGTESWNLDHEVTRDHLEVTWNAETSAEIGEISYMVIGEV